MQRNTPNRTVFSRTTLTWLLGAACLLFLVGIALPMLTITKLLIFDNSVSVISAAWTLALNGHYVLFIIVLGFSIILPMVKMVLLFFMLNKPEYSEQYATRLLTLFHEYGRWAMLDVFIVAVLMVTVKLGAIASITIHAGLYVFGAAVLLIMLITDQTVKLMENTKMENIKENNKPSNNTPHDD